MYKQKLITKDLKNYVMPKGTQPVKVQGNPKIHKKNHPFRTIINGSNHEKRTKVVGTRTVGKCAKFKYIHQRHYRFSAKT